MKMYKALVCTLTFKYIYILNIDRCTLYTINVHILIHIFNCIGYCKRYCTVKHCLILLLNSSSMCFNILWLYLCLCISVQSTEQRESIHLYAAPITNSIRQIQMHSLKDLVYSDWISITWKGQEKKKNEKKTQKIHTWRQKWMKIDIDRIIWSIPIVLHPQNTLQLRKRQIFKVYVKIITAADIKDSYREMKKKKPRWIYDLVVLLDGLWLNESTFSYKSDNCKMLFSCIRHWQQLLYCAMNVLWVCLRCLFPPLC